MLCTEERCCPSQEGQTEQSEELSRESGDGLEEAVAGPWEAPPGATCLYLPALGTQGQKPGSRTPHWAGTGRRLPQPISMSPTAPWKGHSVQAVPVATNLCVAL